MKVDVKLLGDKSVTVYSEDDVEATLERNKVLRSMPQNSDWGRHVASIPAIVLVQWLNEEYKRGNNTIKLFDPEFEELVWRKLQDPDWSYLRVDK